MAEVYTDTLVELVHTTTREQFATRFPHLFLVIQGAAFGDALGFSTQVIDPAAAKKAAYKASPDLEVFPIVKAEGNPYPERVAVGRARNCDVVMRDASVSKLHAHFRVGGPKLELVDIDSQNGSRVNGRALAPHQPIAVEPGDTISFGNVAARLLDARGVYDLLR